MFKLFGKKDKTVPAKRSVVKKTAKKAKPVPKPKRPKHTQKTKPKPKAKNTPATRMEERHETEHRNRETCFRCSRPHDFLYTCSICGHKFCFEHIEDDYDKFCCIDCLKKQKR